MIRLRLNTYCSFVVLLALSATPALGQGKKPAVKEIDAGTIAVYEKLGAEYGGWVNWDNRPDILSASFVSQSERAEHDDPEPVLLPGFRFKTFPMAKLPRVAVPFGLNLSNSNATDADIEKGDALDNLVILDLRYSRITGAGLKGFAGFNKLAALRLSGGQPAAAGLKHLAGLKGLVSLEIENASIDEAAFKAVGGLKNLERFYQGGGTTPNPEWIKELAGLKKLNTLQIEMVTPTSIEAISQAGLLHALPNAAGKNGTRPSSADEVVSLELEGYPKDLARARIFKNVASLRFSKIDFGPQNFSYKNLAALLKDVARFEELAELDFSDGSGRGMLRIITGVGLNELANLKHLVTLNLNGAGLRRNGMKDLAALKNLTTLKLGATPIDDADLKHLAGLTKLASLDLHSTQITNAGMKEIASFSSLGELVLSNTRVRDLGVKELSRLTNLTALDLSDTEVTDAALRELVGLKKLATLNLVGTRTTDAGIAEMQKALPNCKIER